MANFCQFFMPNPQKPNASRYANGQLYNVVASRTGLQVGTEVIIFDLFSFKTINMLKTC